MMVFVLAMLAAMLAIASAQCTRDCTCSAGKYAIVGTKIYESCLDHYTSSASTGLYTIDPGGTGSFQVLCDFDTSGGPYTVFQLRTAAGWNSYGDLWRNKGWSQYESGFWGNDNNHWLGLAKMYRLTQLGGAEMRIKLGNSRNQYAHYSSFSLGSSSANYALYISGFSGSVPDYMSVQNSMPFSTYDRNNRGGCGGYGSWWFYTCHYTLLNYHHPWTRQTYYSTYATYWPGCCWSSYSQMAIKVTVASSPTVACEACPIGKYQNSNTFEGTSCQACGVGQFMASTQATVCNNCYSGKVQPGTRGTVIF